MQVQEELKDLDIPDNKIDDIVKSRLQEEIKKGVQTMQYQINTLNTSNG